MSLIDMIDVTPRPKVSLDYSQMTNRADDVLALMPEPKVAFLRVAYCLASIYSHDPRTQLGAVLVDDMGIIGAGVNCFPEGVDVTPDRLAGDNKYSFMEHAERNAILSAARDGFSTAGSTLYCPWYACCDCARAIIQAGITRVVGHAQARDRGNPAWQASITKGMDMFHEAGVRTEWYDGPIGGVEVRFNGEYWSP
jgi:dCMP deaminase